MSDVTRYDVFMGEDDGEDRMMPRKDGAYVASSDYDRDMQALRLDVDIQANQFYRERDRAEALQRRVEELEVERKIHNVLFASICGHDVQDPLIAIINPVTLVHYKVDALTARFAACEEALKEMDYALIGGNNAGEPIPKDVVAG